jgi:hypothetical protein
LTINLNYNTNQWIIAQYPCGAGGKFICVLLFLFDQVQHWYGIDNPYQQCDFFKNTLEQNVLWLSKELNHSWGLDFFSRSYLRNNDLSSKQFNSLVQKHQSTGFKQAWENKKIIVDHWHKPVLPNFWSQALSVGIEIDDFEIYKKLILKKIYRVDQNNKIIISLLDDPTQQVTDSNIKNLNTYKNDYVFHYDNLDKWLQEHLSTKPWYLPWVQPFESKFTWKFGVSDLVDYKKILKRLEPVEDRFQQKLDRSLIKNFHDCWVKVSF